MGREFASRAAIALAARLEAAAAVLIPANETTPTSDGEGPSDAGVLLDRLVRHVIQTQDASALWLTMAAVSTTFPRDEDLESVRRQFELSGPVEAALALLDWGFSAMQRNGAPTATLKITSNVVVDVDYCARLDLHTGIQRVVRETVPRWAQAHEIDIVAWSGGFGAYRPLDAVEEGRVLRGSGPVGRSHLYVSKVAEIVVPWRTTLVLTELPGDARIPEAVAALAQWSGNRVVAIGYDCIPVTSAETRPPAEDSFFGAYLGMIKHVDLVVGISRSSREEFEGFASMMPAQGLTGPRVVECLLPGEAPIQGPPTPTQVPVVLVVGSHEPRKNHLAVLQACEVLWREGLEFNLRFIGGSAWMSDDFDHRLDELVGAGRPIRLDKKIPDDALWRAYSEARISLFPSLHEGYGLPVAESLAVGTPVITSDYGSTREIADLGGGCLLVDPRDDDALTDALRRCLVDDELMASLRAEISTRPKRSWSDYARQLWDLVEERS